IAALAVTAGASDADALVGRLVLALPHREIAAMDRDAVPRAVAAAHPAGKHAAQVLHHAARRFIVRGALDLHPSRTLLELERAARHHHVARGRWHSCRRARCW